MTIIGEYPAAVPSDTIEDTCPAAVPWCTEHRVSLDHYGTGRHYDLHSTDLIIERHGVTVDFSRWQGDKVPDEEATVDVSISWPEGSPYQGSLNYQMGSLMGLRALLAAGHAALDGLTPDRPAAPAAHPTGDAERLPGGCLYCAAPAGTVSLALTDDHPAPYDDPDDLTGPLNGIVFGRALHLLTRTDGTVRLREHISEQHIDLTRDELAALVAAAQLVLAEQPPAATR